MKKLLEKVEELFEKFKSQNKKIKIAIVIAIIAVLGAIISTIIYSSSNKYAVLFTKLDDADAKSVMVALTDEKIDSKVDSATNTIWVPKNQVDKLKLELAPTLTGGSGGYELMDNGSSFGMTDDEFKLKKKRILEGELEKTIKNLEPIEEAKVTINEAQNSVFVSDATKGSASVALKIKDGQTLTEEQVKSIIAVVATNDIPKENVSVVDQGAHLLSKDLNSDETGEISSETLSKQKSLEENYEDKLQKAIVSLLEPVVGKNKVKAIVNVNMDFDSKQKTETTIDPNKVIVSQETLKELNSAKDGTVSESPIDNNMSNEINDNNSTSSSTKEEQKTNYDSGKSETKTITAQGEVKRLTATVFIDRTLTDDEQQIFHDGVANAIGVNEVNGDKISVIGMPFDQTEAEEAEKLVEQMNNEIASKTKTRNIIIGSIAAAIILGLIIFLLIKRRKKKEEEEEQLLDTLIDDTIVPKEPETFDPIEFETQTKNSHLESEIKRYAKEKPEQVVEIIKSWMNENER